MEVYSIMRLGSQVPYNDEVLRFCKQMGADYVDTAPARGLGIEEDGCWHADKLMQVREHVESFGLTLEAMHLPLGSAGVDRQTCWGHIMLGTPERDREIERATGAEESASARKPTAPLPYDAFHIRASMTGGYGQILAFLHRLTRFPKIVGVEEVHIRPIVQTDSGGPRHLLQVEVRLKAYVLKERAGTAAGATTGAV